MFRNKIKILAVSGSLRANSSNAILLQAIEKMMPEDVEFFVYKGVGSLPHFDDADEMPITVSVWKKHLQEADAVLVCSPEYAFGVPGSLKNAFDWTVGSGDMVNKPLVLITASTGGEKAHAAWLQIFKALSARIPESSALLISFVRSKLSAAGEISDAITAAAIQLAMEKLILMVKENTATGDGITDTIQSLP
ncbi:MAG: NAD(P)H-dependent oxidoreductase [Chitinophagaceae bacterium]